jgi:eukaryotic-like serine/threonine-protein kinase
MSDRIGQHLGNYRLAQLLGQGGFADVYLGEHLYLNTKAAIKVLQKRLSNEDMADFQNEARTIASLVHPHIVRVLDFGVDNATPYLVMDYAPNGTLRQFFPKAVPLPPQRILPYVKQVASALLYAHERKIVHRDIKPENMLLGSNNAALLSDFGIATASQSSRFEGREPVVGTASYMAPEQIQGKPVTASDQYALGIVVYEWLTGDRPFRGTFTEVASQHILVAPPPLRQKVPAISPEIEQVVMIALAKEPRQRFANVEAFANAFEQAIRAPSSAFAFYPDSVEQIEPTVLARPANPPTVVASANVVTPPPHHAANYGETPAPPLYTPPIRQVDQGISRRTFILGMTGIGALVVAGGAFVLWKTSHQGSGTGPIIQNTPTTAATTQATSQPTPVPTQAPTQPAPTSPSGIALGTTRFIYRGHQGQVNADTWSPDGSRVATGGQDTTVQVWDALTGGNVVVYRGHTKWIWAVDWQPHGQLVASGSSDATVQIWNAQSATPNLTYTGHSSDIFTVAWSPDGTRIASAGNDNTVQVWNAGTRQLIKTYTGHTAAIHQVAWSPDGRRIVSAGEDKTARVWDANTGQTYVTYTLHTDRVLTVAWSHTGTSIASGSWDATAHVWNASTGSELAIYNGHSQRVWSVAWSPDDTKIVSGSHDGTAHIWSSSTAGHIYTYTGHGSGNTVWQALWSPNGQMIASAGYDGTAQVWQAQ